MGNIQQLKIRKNMMTFDSQVIKNRMERIAFKLKYTSTLNRVINEAIDEINSISITPLTVDKAYGVAGTFCAEALKTRILDLGNNLAFKSSKKNCETKDKALFCIAGNWGDDIQHCTYYVDKECPVEVDVENIEYQLGTCSIMVRCRTSWNLNHYVTGRRHVHHESMTVYFSVGELGDHKVGYLPLTNKSKVMDLLGHKVKEIKGVK